MRLSIMKLAPHVLVAGLTVGAFVAAAQQRTGEGTYIGAVVPSIGKGTGRVGMVWGANERRMIVTASSTLFWVPTGESVWITNTGPDSWLYRWGQGMPPHQSSGGEDGFLWDHDLTAPKKSRGAK